MDAPALETHDLSVSYRGKPVLHGVDVEVPGGSLTGIMGPNGAGKSTLLKAIMGVIPADTGWVKILGKPLKAVTGRVGYVPQRETVDTLAERLSYTAAPLTARQQDQLVQVLSNPQKAARSTGTPATRAAAQPGEKKAKSAASGATTLENWVGRLLGLRNSVPSGVR